MSDRDSFIEEVSEEVRRDRMYSLWRRFGPVLIGVLVLGVVGAGAWSWWRGQQVEAARRDGAALIAAAETAPTEAASALSTLADQTDRDGAAILARLRAAGLYAAKGDQDAAAAAYDVVASDGSAHPLLRDFAAYRAAIARAPSQSPEARIDAMAPIADGDGPFRLLAVEAQALAKLEAGDQPGAVAALREVVNDDASPQGLRQRAGAVLAALGEDMEPDAGQDG